MKLSPLNGSRRTGFTLMEVMLAVAVIGLLTGGIFAVLRGAVTMSATIMEEEEKSMRMHAFCELLRRNFEQMPGNSKLILTPTGGANSGYSDVAFSEYPLAFSWPGVTAGSKMVVFRTDRARSGIGTEASVFYLDEDQAKEYTDGTNDGSQVLSRLSLMEGFGRFDWRVYDDAKNEWVVEWTKDQTTRPSFVELSVDFVDGSDPVRLVFWIPQMVDPQQVTQAATGAAAGGAVPGGGGPGGPGGGGPGGGGAGPPGGGGQGGAGAGGGRGQGGRGQGGQGQGGGRGQGGQGGGAGGGGRGQGGGGGGGQGGGGGGGGRGR